MAQIQPVPRHLSATIAVGEAFDLIMTLRSVAREFENVPESVALFAAELEAAYAAVTEGGELPQVADAEDGGSAVPA